MEGSDRGGWVTRLRSVVRFAIWVLAWTACFGADAAAPPAVPLPAPPATPSATQPPAPSQLPVSPVQVVNHVSSTTTWYRRIVALQQLPVDSDDVVPRERLRQVGLASLQLAFEFGLAAGRLAAKPAPA